MLKRLCYIRVKSIRNLAQFGVKSEVQNVYESGQYFINKLFGYRGVVLFSNEVHVKHHMNREGVELGGKKEVSFAFKCPIFSGVKNDVSKNDRI